MNENVFIAKMRELQINFRSTCAGKNFKSSYVLCENLSSIGPVDKKLWASKTVTQQKNTLYILMSFGT